MMRPEIEPSQRMPWWAVAAAIPAALYLAGSPYWAPTLCAVAPGALADLIEERRTPAVFAAGAAWTLLMHFVSTPGACWTGQPDLLRTSLFLGPLLLGPLAMALMPAPGELRATRRLVLTVAALTGAIWLGQPLIQYLLSCHPIQLGGWMA